MHLGVENTPSFTPPSTTGSSHASLVMAVRAYSQNQSDVAL